MEPDWHESADYWRGRTCVWMAAGDAMANALTALLRDDSVVAAARPEDLERAQAALACHPHGPSLFSAS
jgi:hypothetical protein